MGGVLASRENLSNQERFVETHKYQKPNDIRGIDLMDECAKAVFREMPDIVLAYGQSDEYSFIFERNTKLFNRRARFIPFISYL
jgi:tRNA(His) guanylyltransferase